MRVHSSSKAQTPAPKRFSVSQRNSDKPFPSLIAKTADSKSQNPTDRILIRDENSKHHHHVNCKLHALQQSLCHPIIMATDQTKKHKIRYILHKKKLITDQPSPILLKQNTIQDSTPNLSLLMTMDDLRESKIDQPAAESPRKRDISKSAIEDETRATKSSFRGPGKPTVIVRSKTMQPDRSPRMQIKKELLTSISQVSTQPKPIRSYTEAHHLLNLLHGVFMQPRVKLQSEGQLTPCRVLIGDGNNSGLVRELLKSKPGVVAEVFFSKSHLQWTQHPQKQLVSTPLYRIGKSSLASVDLASQLASLDVLQVEQLTQAIIDQKLFRVSNTDLIREIISVILRTERIHILTPETTNIVNHLKGIGVITEKMQLTKTIISYCRGMHINPFTIIPMTFLLRKSSIKADWKKLLKSKQRDDPLFKEPLIFRPGLNSNKQKESILVESERGLKAQVRSILEDNEFDSTIMVQYYLSSPLLFLGRKFDVRCYGLVVRTSPRSLSFYWYLDGYARTSSFLYDANDKHNPLVHLTNEAVQVRDKAHFGSQEPGNKVYFGRLDEHFSSDPAFMERGKQWNRDMVPLFKVDSS
jgi:Tubulin-tyrosine ligase family